MTSALPGATPLAPQARRRQLLWLGGLVLFVVWTSVAMLLEPSKDASSAVKLVSLREGDAESERVDDTTVVVTQVVDEEAKVHTRIPRIIHQSWKSTTRIPSRFVPWMRSWVEMHPGWQYVFWGDDDNLALFDRLYPQYKDVAHKVGKIALADMARYALLHRLGGLYADADFECKQPFDELHREYDVFLSSEPRAHAILLEHHSQAALCNAIMASVPGHPFWIQVLDAIKDMFDKGMNRGDPVSLTGPRIVKATYERYVQSKADVTVLASEFFYPQVATWNMENMLHSCRVEATNAVVKEACDWLRKFPDGEFTKNTHAVHHWQCTWCRGDNDNKMVPLSEVMQYSNGAPMFIFKPQFSRDDAGNDQVELVQYDLA